MPAVTVTNLQRQALTIVDTSPTPEGQAPKRSRYELGSILDRGKAGVTQPTITIDAAVWRRLSKIKAVEGLVRKHLLHVVGA